MASLRKKATPEPVPQHPEATSVDFDFLTIAEAARYVRVGRKVIDKAIKEHRLKVLQLSASRRRIRIYKQDLIDARTWLV